nr:reverse transcriptase domain-containing protein [Tanacetum cinerariifolium]
MTPKEEPVTLDRPKSLNPFLHAIQVEFTFKEIAFTTNIKVALLYPSHPNQEYFKGVSEFISKCCLKEAFTRAPNQYKEYLSEFWYTTKVLQDSKIWVSTPTGEVRGEICITTFRNALRAQYLSHSSMYLPLPSTTTVRPWFATIGYNGEIEAKGTLKKSCLPPRCRLLTSQIIQCLGGKTGGLDQISNKDATILYCLANGVQLDYAKIIWEDIIHKLNKKTRVMSSPNHPTFDIEDVFSSNSPNYNPASPDYSPASPGNTPSKSLNNSYGLVSIASPTLSLFHDDLYIMVPKRTSTSAAPSMNQAAIRQLIDDRVAAALDAQAANMANTDNTNRNPEPRETPATRKCSYKEFMSCQPFNFKGLEGAVGHIRWFEHTESMFSRSNYTKDYKVKFATGTLTEEALSWWNSFAQPIRIEEAYKLSWVEFKKLLIKKYCPRTDVQKIEDEFYHLTVKEMISRLMLEDSKN